MKYKKIAIFIMLVLCTIPICLYISGIVHLFLTEQITTITELNITTILNSVIRDKEHFRVFILLQSLITLFLFLVTFIAKDNIYASNQNKITNNISTPAKAGQGQYGNASWLKNKDFSNVFTKNVLDVGKDIKEQDFKSGGLIVKWNKLKNGNEEIYYINSNTHCLVVGATRSVKAELL